MVLNPLTIRSERPACGGLSGLRALITGGSSGIGAATARAFAARGAHVAIAGRNLEALRRVAADTNGVCVPGDLREQGWPRQTVYTASDALGGLDVIVSNAGIGWAGPFASPNSTMAATKLSSGAPSKAIAIPRGMRETPLCPL